MAQEWRKSGASGANNQGAITAMIFTPDQDAQIIILRRQHGARWDIISIEMGISVYLLRVRYRQLRKQARNISARTKQRTCLRCRVAINSRFPGLCEPCRVQNCKISVMEPD